MDVKRRVLREPNFYALFKVQFLGAMNDNVLKNGLLVLITFSGVTLWGLPQSQVVSISLFLLVLPYFLFSSYAGKIADCSNKVKIVRTVKFCEVIIMLFAAVGFYIHQVWMLMVALFAMGAHSAFFGPVKYSIVPQYLPRSDVVMAIGYIEMGTFIGILLGQTMGSWFVASGYINSVIALAVGVSLVGLYYSFKMEYVPPTGTKIKLYLNPIKDSWKMYHSVVVDKVISRNLHAISWFWAVGAIYTTQLPILVLYYYGGNGHVFSIILSLFSLGIGIGSVVCAKLSNGRIVRAYVPLGVLGMSMCSIILLLTHIHPTDIVLNLTDFTLSLRGALVFTLCLLNGIAAGFYSVTCYSELQLTSPEESRSQIISANNILNSLYIVVASLISIALLIFISVWTLLLLLALSNLVFAFNYHRSTKRNALIAEN